LNGLPRSSLDYPEQTKGDQAARIGRRIHEHDDVDRIAVGRQRPWHEPEVEREVQASRQAMVDGEDPLIGQELELVAAAPR
jgi:hypothetical protein